MSPADRVGQLFMVGADSRTGLSQFSAAQVRRAGVGSAILLGNTTAGSEEVKRVTAEVRDALGERSGIGVLIAADQEGGQVQRLRGPGFDRIPSAEEQSRLGDDELRRQAETWGRQLRAAGVDADLAPVADVVPDALRDVNQPIGVLRRGYGSDRTVVARKVVAFTTGMQRAGVLTSVKHFPGLGTVRGNTDFVARVVDDRTNRDDPDLAGFRSAVATRVDMVMVSLAYYTRIDADRPAAFSSAVIDGMLREDFGFDGVVISDDLAARAARFLSPQQRALQFLRAGGDLMIVGDPSLVRRMAVAVTREVRTDARLSEHVTEAALRVLEMKAGRGLASC